MSFDFIPKHMEPRIDETLRIFSLLGRVCFLNSIRTEFCSNSNGKLFFLSLFSTSTAFQFHAEMNQTSDRSENSVFLHHDHCSISIRTKSNTESMKNPFHFSLLVRSHCPFTIQIEFNLNFDRKFSFSFRRDRDRSSIPIWTASNFEPMKKFSFLVSSRSEWSIDLNPNQIDV